MNEGVDFDERPIKAGNTQPFDSFDDAEQFEKIDENDAKLPLSEKVISRYRLNTRTFG